MARKSHAFAFFPEITKGGLVFGGAYGRGVVYERGQLIGYADVTQASFGLQAGGQTYSELIVFENKDALERFKLNSTDFGANASAIIAENGASTNARFVDGVAVFVRPTVGAMAEASLSGQRTTYVAKSLGNERRFAMSLFGTILQKLGFNRPAAEAVRQGEADEAGRAKRFPSRRARGEAEERVEGAARGAGAEVQGGRGPA